MFFFPLSMVLYYFLFLIPNDCTPSSGIVFYCGKSWKSVLHCTFFVHTNI